MSGSLVLDAVAGLCTVQDGGRPGWRAHGVPPGGALVPAWLGAANRAVGNPADAPALEYTGPTRLRLSEGRLVCAGGHRHRLAPGEVLALPGPHPAAVGYVAVAGGVAAEAVLGGRGALLGGLFPGFAGRALMAGDVLPLGPDPAAPAVEPDDVRLDAAAPLRVVAGPDLDAFGPAALDALYRTRWQVTATGRSGTRLAGAPLPRRDDDARRSAPVVRGAVQVPADGQPLVLGPDGPTVGGYPVIGVLLRVDAEALAARPPGAWVRMVPA